MVSSTIARNRDGGISVFEGSVSLSNTTVSQNSGHTQGGVLGENVTISHSTIVGNQGQFTVGGIYGSQSVSLSNSIVAGNIGPDANSNDILGSASATHSLIGSAASSGGIQHGVNGNIVGNNGSGTIPLASVLNPTLANNGGRTFTHALVAGSLATNAGIATSLTSDQRGLARTFGPAPDMGAYELQPESYTFWSAYTFPASVPLGARVANADYDGDGIVNGLERATGLDPLSRNAPGELVSFEIQGGNLVLQFERSITVDPTKVFAEQSLQLQQWTNTGIIYQVLGPASATTELIHALIPLDGAPKKFGRLRYTP